MLAQNGIAVRADEGPLLWKAETILLKGIRLEAPRPPVSGWPVEALGQGEKPEAPGDEPGDGCVLTLRRDYG